MRLVQSGLVLFLSNIVRTVSYTHKIHKALGVRTAEPDFAPERGIDFKDEKGKAVVIWRPNYCKIAIEDVSNTRDHISTILSFLERINDVAPIGEIRASNLMTNWIHPTPNYTFAALVSKYSEIMVAENDISNAAYDSSVLYDIGINAQTLHHQSGAMDPSQLQRNYLHFKLDNIPKTFIFLEATIKDDNVIQYSTSWIKH